MGFCVCMSEYVCVLGRGDFHFFSNLIVKDVPSGVRYQNWWPGIIFRRQNQSLNPPRRLDCNSTAYSLSVGHVSWIPSPLILIPLNLNTSVGHDFRIMPIKGLGAP